jgi:uncharacterized protein (UPF0332 family)
MTNSEEECKQLAAMRMVKADSALADASMLVERGSSYGAINRCYYAMFHAASALAIRDNCVFHKHRAVISWFLREYVKSGRIARELGKSLQQAFERRCDADYTDAANFTAEEVKALFEQARRFVVEVKSLLKM